jgi:hypothetical protein
MSFSWIWRRLYACFMVRFIPVTKSSPLVTLPARIYPILKCISLRYQLVNILYSIMDLWNKVNVIINLWFPCDTQWLQRQSAFCPNQHLHLPLVAFPARIYPKSKLDITVWARPVYRVIRNWENLGLLVPKVRIIPKLQLLIRQLGATS